MRFSRSTGVTVPDLDAVASMNSLCPSWTLAHAHGTLFSILNLLFAMSIRLTPDWKASSRTLASRCLLGALVLLPLGFFLGGVFIYGGDPGLGVILVPPGALLLFISVLLIARASRDSAK